MLRFYLLGDEGGGGRGFMYITFARLAFQLLFHKEKIKTCNIADRATLNWVSFSPAAI